MVIPFYTDPVANLTLVIEDELLKEARKLAIDQNTSVNQMEREFLESKVNQWSRREQARQRLLSTRLNFEMQPFNRDEIYEPSLKANWFRATLILWQT